MQLPLFLCSFGLINQRKKLHEKGRYDFVLGLVDASYVSITGCYPEGYETYQETDIVVTDYNTNYNFSGIGTYIIPDTIHYIGEEDPDRSWDNFIIGELEQGFESMGYTRLAGLQHKNPPDVVITVSVLRNENTNIYSDPWYPGWGYGGWGYPGYGWGYWGYPGYGYGYPWGGYTYISSYSIGLSDAGIYGIRTMSSMKQPQSLLNTQLFLMD